MSAEAHDNPPTQAAPAEAIADLAARIARWLPTARWFPGKDRAAGSVRVIDRVEIPGTGGLAVALVADTLPDRSRTYAKIHRLSNNVGQP